jgi:hypothetical protein
MPEQAGNLDSRADPNPVLPVRLPLSPPCNSMDGRHPTPPDQPGTHQQVTAVKPSLVPKSPVSNDKTENSESDNTTKPSATPSSSSTPSLVANKTTSGRASTERMVSLRGFITVFHFEQHQVNSEISSVVVTMQFTHCGMRSQSSTTVTPGLQICLGESALATTVVALPETSAAGSSTNTLDASSPKLLRLLADIPGRTKPTKLTIRALLGDTIIDSIHFGYYTPRKCNACS